MYSQGETDEATTTAALTTTPAATTQRPELYPRDPIPEINLEMHF